MDLPCGFAVWICRVDLPCASTLPSLPTCPPCPMYPSCAQSVCRACCAERVTAPARGSQEFAADAGHDTRHAQRRTLPRQPRRRRHADADTQTRDTQAQANPVRRQTPRRQTRRAETCTAETRRQTRRQTHRQTRRQTRRRALLEAIPAEEMLVLHAHTHTIHTVYVSLKNIK